MITQKSRLSVMLGLIAVLLLIPLIAMQFTDQVDWSIIDFLVMGILLLVTVFLIEEVLRKVKKSGNRFILCGIILFVLFLIWAELAVGILGTPFAGS